MDNSDTRDFLVAPS